MNRLFARDGQLLDQSIHNQSNSITARTPVRGGGRLLREGRPQHFSQKPASDDAAVRANDLKSVFHSQQVALEAQQDHA